MAFTPALVLRRTPSPPFIHLLPDSTEASIYRWEGTLKATVCGDYTGTKCASPLPTLLAMFT